MTKTLIRTGVTIIIAVAVLSAKQAAAANGVTSITQAGGAGAFPINLNKPGSYRLIHPNACSTAY